MASVTSLATHLLGLLQPNVGQTVPSGQAAPSAQPVQTVAKTEAARLAFYHFLKNLCEPGEPLSTATIERFFRRSLAHSHWAEHKLELFNEVAACLQHYSNATGEAIPLPPFASPYDIQVVRAESFRTLEKVVEEWIQAHQGPTDQIRILRDREEKLLVCNLGVDRNLAVHIFDRNLCIREGRLEPLNDDMAVFYTADLSIDSSRNSQIEIAPHTVARFRFTTANGTQGFRGVQVRGYTFQKTGSFEGSELHRLPTLFYPLKRIEQFFINRTTDPMYIELTNLLEQASDLMARQHPERLRFAEAAMERGRLAFEQVFVDDRFLRLLLENLERAVLLENREMEKRESETREMRSSDGLANLPNAFPDTLPVELAPQVGHSSGLVKNNHIGLNLPPGQEFIEPEGPDLVELQEAEKCETIAPKNAQPVLEEIL